MAWWRAFVDKLTGKAEAEASGPRRRRHPRYTFEHPLRAKCTSWGRFADLFTGDISSGGLFIPTEERAQPGERVELELSLPDEITLRIGGTVVVELSVERAARL